MADKIVKQFQELYKQATTIKEMMPEKVAAKDLWDNFWERIDIVDSFINITIMSFFAPRKSNAKKFIKKAQSILNELTQVDPIKVAAAIHKINQTPEWRERHLNLQFTSETLETPGNWLEFWLIAANVVFIPPVMYDKIIAI